MPKLTLLQGLPASGKSTKAREMVEKNGGTVRVNKDLIRTMLHFDKFTGKNEALTFSVAKSIAATALKDGYHVVVDDTNLNPGTVAHWQALAENLSKDFQVTFEIVKMKTSIKECLERDEKREKRVGASVIKNMALRYGLFYKPYRGYVLCDIDGTIADTSHRLHHVKKEPKDWKGFFSDMHLDPVRQDTLERLRSYVSQEFDVIFISARPDNYRAITETWLEQLDLKYMTLLMRKAGDRRDDDIVKREMLEQYFPDRSQIHVVIDDRPRVIEMWKAEGLKVIDVGKGEDF